MFTSGLFNLCIFALIIMVVSSLLKHFTGGIILSVAIVAGYFSELPLLTMGTQLTQVNTTIFVYQIIMNVLTLSIFVLGLAHYINGDLYRFVKNFTRPSIRLNTMDTWDKLLFVISAIGIVVHQYRIFPKAHSTAIISLIITVIISVYLYAKDHREYIIAQQNSRIRQAYQRRYNQEQEYQQRQQTIHNNQISRRNILQEIEFYKNQLRNVQSNLNNIQNDSDYSGTKELTLVKNDYINNLKQHGVNLNDINDFNLTENIGHETNITNDKYLKKAESYAPSLLNISAQTLDRIIDNGDTATIYKFLDKLHKKFGKYRQYHILYSLRRCNKALKYTHVLSDPDLFTAEIKTIWNSISAIIESFSIVVIGETGERFTRNCIESRARYLYKKHHPNSSFRDNSFKNYMKRYMKKHNSYVWHDLNLADKSRNSDNNQIDILAFNPYGIFAFEVKTYKDKYLRITDTGKMYEYNKDMRNYHNFKEAVKRYKNNGSHPGPIYDQTRDHISDVALLFHDIDNTVNPYEVHHGICHSPLVWVRTKNSRFSRDERQGSLAKQVTCLRPEECWGYMRSFHQCLKPTQINNIKDTIINGKLKGKVKGDTFGRTLLTEVGKRFMPQFNNMINELDIILKSIKTLDHKEYEIRHDTLKSYYNIRTDYSEQINNLQNKINDLTMKLNQY